jgi:hypothetical protein
MGGCGVKKKKNPNKGIADRWVRGLKGLFPGSGKVADLTVYSVKG